MTPGAGRPRYILSVRSPSGEAHERELPEGSLAIGRAADCEIRLPDDALSRRHARITRHGDEVVFEDLGSRNGSFLNGRPVRSPARMLPGDAARVGGVLLRLEWLSPVSLEGEPGGSVPAASVVIDATRMPTEETRRLFADMAEENRALGLLTRAGGLLITHGPLPETLDAVLDLCLAGFDADRAAVALLSSESAVPIVAAARTRSGATDLRVSRAVARAVVTERMAVAVTDVEGDPRVNASESVRLQGVRSLAVAPLWDGSRVSGLLYVDRQQGRGAYSETDVRLLALLANVVAIRIENARLLDEALAKERLHEELAVARAIQQGLMPAGSPRMAGVDVHGTCRPCSEIGGDFFDFFPLPSGRLALVVADVCGKGVSGALVAAGVQAALRGGAHVDVPPSQRLLWLDEHVARAPAARYVTAAYVEVSPATGDVAFARAGHPPPLVLRSDGSVEALLTGGPPLGLAAGARLADGHARLMAGDRLVLATDGVLEASPPGRREDAFGTERLARAAQSAATARGACGAVFDALLEHVEGSPLRDDATVVVLIQGGRAPAPADEVTASGHELRFRPAT